MSSTTSNPTRRTALTRVQALIAGTQKHFPNESFTLGNTAYTTATLVQALESLTGALARLSAAHASVKDAGMALRGIEATVGPLVRDYKRFILAAFSTATQTLADFGLQPPKARKPLDSQQRAVATAKRRATRKARGTTSRKQKLGVKGDVTGVNITPVTHATASPQSATPAETPGPVIADPSSTAHASSGAAK